MFYQLAVSGQTYSGNTSFPSSSTIYTPLAAFATQSSILAVEPTIRATNTGNGANPFDIALYMGDPYDGNVQAGELAWAGNDSVHALYRNISPPVIQGGGAIDEVSYTFDGATNTHTFSIDESVANITTIDEFISRTSFFTAPKQIIGGVVSFSFSADGSSVSGSAVFIGKAYIEPGVYAWAGTFSGQAFNGLAYIASYGDLSAAFGPNAEAGRQHYLHYGFNEGRVASFNGYDYIASYHDLILAFGANADAGSSHYITNGRAEGRSPDAFDGLQYIAAYDDLIGAFGQDEHRGARHFAEYGFREGRAQDGFDGLQYIATYNDLIPAFGADEHAGALHYIQYGQHEGRGRDGFDGQQYIASYGDLIRAFGADEHMAAWHYIVFGFREGRSRDTFDAAHYLAKYPDLQAAFGNDLNAATHHFIEYGFNEGRSDDLLV